MSLEYKNPKLKKSQTWLKRAEFLVVIPLFLFALVFLIFKPQISLAAFSCDLGSLDTTCYITTEQTMDDGSSVTGPGNIIIQSGGNLTTAQTEFFTIDMDGDVTIEDSGTITGNLTLLEAANFDLQSGGSINLNTQGYAVQQGPGAGGVASNYGSGAGHGGNGGNSSTGASGGSAYGSTTEPTTIGSGGGQGATGGSGGGAVKITVSDTTTINGSITTNGGNGGYVISPVRRGGGGAGGSVHITTTDIIGSGSITANGGNGSGNLGGGGAGGRIALYWTTDSASSITKQAYGGVSGGSRSGGAGTVFLKAAADTNGDLITDNNDSNGANTPQIGTLTVDDFTVKDYAKYTISTGTTLSVSDSVSNCTTNSSLTVDGTLNLPTAADTISTPGTWTYGGTINTLSSTLLINNGVSFTSDTAISVITDLTLNQGSSFTSNDTFSSITTITIDNSTLTNNAAMNNLTSMSNTATSTITNNGSIDSLATLTLTGTTFYQNGTLASLTDLTIGSASTFEFQNLNNTISFTLDDLTIQDGGTLRHEANSTTQADTLNLIINNDFDLQSGGSINLNSRGYNQQQGPGKGVGTWASGAGHGGNGGNSNQGTPGGSAYGSTTEPLTIGSGGGQGSAGRPGGGAVKITVSDTTTINGSITATGGNGIYVSGVGYGGGGAGGSVYITTTGLAGSGSISANGGNGYSSIGGAGAGGRIALYWTTDSSSSINKQARGGSGGYQKGGAGTIFTKAAAATNGDFTVDNASVNGVNTPQVGTLTVDTFTVKDYAKYIVSTDLTLTVADSVAGGNSTGYLTINGTLNLPSTTGSLSNPGTWSLASTGDINNFDATVTMSNSISFTSDTTIPEITTLNLDSVTYTNSTNGSLPNLTTLTFDNSGVLQNNGAIDSLATLIFSNGTFYQNGTLASLTTLTIGDTGTFEFQNLSTSTSFTFDDITIQDGGTLTHQANSTTQADTLNLVINNNLDIQSGGSINLNQRGYTSNQGPGVGQTKVDKYGTYRSGGGGHGGNGGNGLVDAAYPTPYGGSAYGSTTEPTTIGSGGGGGAGGGGAGGGILKITVSDTTTINGSITANSGNGAYAGGCYGGGGAGGGIYITTTNLTGSGSITTNGGNGASNLGGGGAGGRIALYWTTDSASSITKQAYGGASGGSRNGGAGTVFLKAAADTNGDLIIDNNDSNGASTPQVGSLTVDDFTVKNYAKYIASETTSLTVADTVSGGTANAYLTINGTLNLPSTTGSLYNPGTWSLTSTGDLNNLDATVTMSNSISFTSDTTIPEITTLTLDSVTYTNSTNGSLPNVTTLPFANSAVMQNNGAIDSLATLTFSNGTFYQNGTLASLTTLTIGDTATFEFQNLNDTTSFTFDDVTIQSGGTLTHEANSSTQADTLNLIINNNLYIQSGGSINLNQRGYTSNQGPGVGETRVDKYGTYRSGGGGHGGNGGYGCVDPAYTTPLGGSAYGSTTEPTTIGSGAGGCAGGGGAGGGMLKITVSDTTTINGSITANSGNGAYAGGCYGGGGAGGGIYITTTNLTGSGSITANGGNGASGLGGGGAGGRIALYWTTDSASSITKQAYGGTTGCQKGGAGTVFTKAAAASNGDLVINNNDVSGAWTPQVGSLTVDDFTVKNYAKYIASETTSLTVADTVSGGTANAYFTINGTLNLPSSSQDISGGPGTITNSSPGIINNATSSFTLNGSVALTNSGTINTVTNLTVEDATFNEAGGTFPAILSQMTVGSSGIAEFQTLNESTSFTLDYLTIQDGGTLRHEDNSTTQADILNLVINNDLDIQSGGSINLNTRGYDRQQGPGKGVVVSNYGSGAGHGGDGGNSQTGASGGSAYGSTTEPTTIGSGGGQSPTGASGGGAVKITVTDTTTINGSITANGGNGTYVPDPGRRGGGGAGGSIYIVTSILAGSGTITANGGNGYTTQGGGGAGGHIALWACSSTYSGTPEVNGGTGWQAGEDGTTHTDFTCPVTGITPICTASGNSCSAQGEAASPQEAYSVANLAGSATDTDSTITEIKISLKDTNPSVNKWYNSVSDTFTATSEYWITATGTSPSWSYNASGITFTLDHTYQLRSKAENLAGQTEYPIQTLSFEHTDYAPEITNVSASQGSDGQVTTTYDITDGETTSTTVYFLYELDITLNEELSASDTVAITLSDTTYFPLSGTIMLDNEMITYTSITGNDLTGTITRAANSSTAASHSSGATVWIQGQTLSGDTGTVSNGNNKTVTWTATTDADDFYSTTVQARIASYDGISFGTANSPNYTLDTTDPVISNIQVSSITQTGATITWTTDESSNSYVEYSTIQGFSSGNETGVDNSVLSHEVTLLALLNPATTYYYKVKSQDSSANQTISSEDSFTTLASPPSGDPSPPPDAPIPEDFETPPDVPVPEDSNPPDAPGNTERWEREQQEQQQEQEQEEEQQQPPPPPPPPEEEPPPWTPGIWTPDLPGFPRPSPYYPEEGEEPEEGEAQEQPLPLEELLEDIPQALRGEWNLLDPEAIYQFVFAPLPDLIQDLSQRVPQLEEKLEELGLNRLSALWKARDLDITLPLYSEQDPLSLPYDLLYAQDLETNLDLALHIAFDPYDFLLPQITTQEGRSLKLFLKPSLPVEDLTGLLLLRPKTPAYDLESFKQREEQEKQRKEKGEYYAILEFTFKDPDQDGIYTTEIPTPAIAGGYDLLALYYQEDQPLPQKELKTVLLIDPEGYLYEQIKEKEVRIPNVTISLYTQDPNHPQKETLWDPSPYNQKNPQTTDKTGTYSFFVPKGSYTLRTEHENYEDHQSTPIEVKEGQGIHDNIRLYPKKSLKDFFDWKVILIILLILTLIIITVFFLRFRKKDLLKNQT